MMIVKHGSVGGMLVDDAKEHIDEEAEKEAEMAKEKEEELKEKIDAVKNQD